MAGGQTPFPENHQLNKQLRLDRSAKPAILCRTDDEGHLTTLPGQPRVRLNPLELDDYLRKELLVPILDQLAPKLWLISTPRSSHVSSLHHQAVRGRSITITENPHLHLVWHYNQIFIKPMPKYLLSYAFWQYLTAQPACVQEAAIGFMRTYSHLVHHESDFALAQEKGLIPRTSSGCNTEDLVTWENFARLIATFEHFGDDSVSPRYSYGELRLTRLNFYSPIFLRKLTFHHIDAQWGTFLNGLIAPLIAVFAIVSIVLNAMQVGLAAGGISNIELRWVTFINVSRWVSVIVLVFATLVMVFFLLLIAFFFFRDIWFAKSIINGKKSDPNGVAWRIRKSGVV